MNARTNLLLGGVGFVLGILVGFAVHATFLCPDTNKAVVEQIRKDSKQLEAARDEIKQKVIIKERIKTIIKTIPAGECLRTPLPDSIGKLLLNSFQSTRPATD